MGEEGVERPGDGAHGVLVEADLLGEVEVAHDDGSADDVAVPTDVLGRRVQHHVGAEGERLLEVGRGEGVVDDEQGAGVVGDASPAPRCRRSSSIGLVGVSTQTSLVRPGLDRGGHRVDVGDRGRAEVEAPDLGDLVEEPERAAVGVVGDDGVVAGAGQRPDDRVLGGEPGGEGEPLLAVLDGRQRALERRTRRVRGAAVLVAAAQAPDTVLLVGAAGVDGRDDRPGHRVGLVAGVDRTRLETGLVGAFLGHVASVDPARLRRRTAERPPLPRGGGRPSSSRQQADQRDRSPVPWLGLGGNSSTRSDRDGTHGPRRWSPPSGQQPADWPKSTAPVVVAWSATPVTAPMPLTALLRRVGLEDAQVSRGGVGGRGRPRATDGVRRAPAGCSAPWAQQRG